MTKSEMIGAMEAHLKETQAKVMSDCDAIIAASLSSPREYVLAAGSAKELHRAMVQLATLRAVEPNAKPVEDPKPEPVAVKKTPKKKKAR